jgi:uncharacterized membrane protein YhiD involved in acid resistance
MWVVASIGMGAGAGYYLLATFATVTILLALSVFGYIETKFGLKPLTVNYEIKGRSAPEILDDLNKTIEDSHHFMHGLQVSRSQNVSRVIFNLTCTLPEHRALQAKLKMRPEFESVTTFDANDEE